MNKGLVELEQLAENIPAFFAHVKGWSDDSSREYPMDKGRCFSWEVETLFPGVSVHRWWAEAGTECGGHAHPESETIVVYEGFMIFRYKDKPDRRVGVGESVQHAPHEFHSASIPEAVRFYSVMVPAAPYFPRRKEDGR